MPQHYLQIFIVTYLLYFINKSRYKIFHRGMIYIMLGPPTVVNITPTSEEWSYGSGQQSVVFTFENYSGLSNDFSLLRSNTYQSIWQQVTTTWRSGKIFTVSKLNNE